MGVTAHNFMSSLAGLAKLPFKATPYQAEPSCLAASENFPNVFEIFESAENRLVEVVVDADDPATNDEQVLEVGVVKRRERWRRFVDDDVTGLGDDGQRDQLLNGRIFHKRTEISLQANQLDIKKQDDQSMLWRIRDFLITNIVITDLVYIIL